MICIRIREQLQRQPGQQDPEPGAGDLQRVPFPAATGAELGHQGGRMDKQTDKQPQAAGTGQIWPNQGSGSGILCRDPEQLQQQPGTGSSCSSQGGHRRGNWLQRDPSADDLHQDPEPGAGDQQQRPGDLQPQAAGSGARNREQLQGDPEQLQQPGKGEPGAGYSKKGGKFRQKRPQKAGKSLVNPHFVWLIRV